MCRQLTESQYISITHVVQIYCSILISKILGPKKQLFILVVYKLFTNAITSLHLLLNNDSLKVLVHLFYVHSSQKCSSMPKCLAYILSRLDDILNWKKSQKSFTAILETYFIK